MKNFLVVATQCGGCDYTIGCGVASWIEQADSLAELEQKIEAACLASDEDDAYDENYSGRIAVPPRYAGEYTYDSLTIYEINDVKAINIVTMGQKILLQKEEKKKAAALQKDLAEYDRLKKQFG